MLGPGHTVTKASVLSRGWFTVWNGKCIISDATGEAQHLWHLCVWAVTGTHTSGTSHSPTPEVRNGVFGAFNPW